MKKRNLLAAAFLAGLSSGAAFAADFRITSTDIADGQPLGQAQFLNSYGCTGGNVSPALAFENVPEGTKSFVLTVFDPDAPTGSGWWHWTAFDIPADVTALASGASGHMPGQAIEARTDFGAPGFGGACPPPGPAHRYVIKVMALSVDKLGLDSTASGAMISYVASGSALATATITALGQR